MDLQLPGQHKSPTNTKSTMRGKKFPDYYHKLVTVAQRTGSLIRSTHEPFNAARRMPWDTAHETAKRLHVPVGSFPLPHRTPVAKCFPSLPREARPAFGEGWSAPKYPAPPLHRYGGAWGGTPTALMRHGYHLPIGCAESAHRRLMLALNGFCLQRVRRLQTPNATPKP